MSKKIKIFDLENKCWIGAQDFINHLVKNTKSNGIELTLDVENNEEYKVCWFTGLKDINDCDIFEGDIVKCNRCEYGVKEPRKFEVRGQILTNLASEVNNGLDTWVTYEDIIVIGNVFEYPELLK